MTLELATRLLNAQPFVSFDLFLSDGRSLPVVNVEMIMIGEDSQSLMVLTPPHIEYIALSLIVSVRFLAPHE